MLSDNCTLPLDRSVSDTRFNLSKTSDEPIGKSSKDFSSSKSQTKLDTYTDNDKAKESRRHSIVSLKKVHHSKQVHNYQSIKVFAVSKCSTRERLKKKMAESKENESVIIDWDTIMAIQA